MPTYEYRCKSCDSTFEVKRPMSASSDPVPCPAGHENTTKLLSMAGLSSGASAPSGGGCCGGGCRG